MPTAHGLSWAKNSSTRSRLSVLRSVTLPRRSTPCRSKICFAISIPILVTCIADPPVVRFDGRVPSLAHYEAVERGLGPSHHSPRKLHYRFDCSPSTWTAILRDFDCSGTDIV